MRKLKNKVKIVWIGIDNDADVRASNIKLTSDGTSFDVTFKGDKKKYQFETRLLGKANVYNILAGIALGYNLGISIPKLTEERRKELVKDIKKIGEESKVAIRSIRRDGIDEAKAKQKNSEITEDDLKVAEDQIQKLTDKKVAEIQAKNFEMESAFESAIAKEDFEVWFQPKYSTKTKTVVGAEALIRWRGKDGNLISPAEFIPLFETDGLIPILDEYVFKKVCDYQKMRLEKGKIIVPISVNLSRASMFKKDFIKNYAKIANDMGISRSCVPIEITESMAVKSSSVKSFAEELINEGFSLHMDDFGAGYSSLASLQILRFDVIKLDKSLIDFIGTQSGESLIKHTVAFAKESGMKVVAEGVEKKEQLDFLRKINCDYIQGFYFAAPMPQKEFDKLLTGASKN